MNTRPGVPHSCAECFAATRRGACSHCGFRIEELGDRIGQSEPGAPATGHDSRFANDGLQTEQDGQAAKALRIADPSVETAATPR